jgi:hypothetical protein
MNGPGLDFQTWETSGPGDGENENKMVEVHRLPHLRIEMWGTQRYWPDMGHPPIFSVARVGNHEATPALLLLQHGGAFFVGEDGAL